MRKGLKNKKIITSRDRPIVDFTDTDILSNQPIVFKRDTEQKQY